MLKKCGFVIRMAFKKSEKAYNHNNRESQQQKFEYLYGVNPIEVALAVQRRKFYSLIISDSQTVNTGFRAVNLINKAKQMNIPITFSPKDKMNRIVSNQPHQNIILKCQPLSEIVNKDANQYEKGVYVYCDKITDPQNFGAIIRSCLFFGVKNIFVPKKNVCPLNSTVSKTSSGASELIEVHLVQKDQTFLEKWKEEGVVISTAVSSQTSQPLSLEQIAKMVSDQQKVMIIMGSEGYGVSPHLARHSNYSTKIPRTGSIEYPNNLIDSLNVNAALTCILSKISC